MRTISCLMAGGVARVVVATTLLMSLLFSGCSASAVEGPKRGQEVLFFPSLASVSGDNQCLLTIQGRVYEPTEKSRSREALIDGFASLVRARRTDPLFRARARYFFSDSSRNTRISVKVGDRVILLPASDPAGYFTGDILLTADEALQLAKGGMITFQSVPTAKNPKRFPGSATLVPEEGVTVISDMDDTIKITDILNDKEKVANTFMRRFKAVPGMPALYRSWMEVLGPRIHFHIVSAGPWQFHEPLRQFTEEAGFPAFTWDMRSVDISDVRVLLKAINPDTNDTYEFKLQKIRAFMARFPKRHVLFVGDSGEKDPDVYAKVLSECPNRVAGVLIRNVRREDQKERYEQLFPSKEAAGKLRVFVDPRELPPLIPTPAGPSSTEGSSLGRNPWAIENWALKAHTQQCLAAR
jgi:phosphatidate phosphatase APP1